MRLSALHRLSAEGILMGLLVLMSAALILLGKIDQSLFQSLQLSVTDIFAPALAFVSRPLVDST